jgi:hypothetical protein
MCHLLARISTNASALTVSIRALSISNSLTFFCFFSLSLLHINNIEFAHHEKSCEEKKEETKKEKDRKGESEKEREREKEKDRDGWIDRERKKGKDRLIDR